MLHPTIVAPDSAWQRLRVNRHTPAKSLWGACMSNDTEYYRERAAAERAMAKATQDPKAAAVHDDMADRYEALVMIAEPRRPKLRIATTSQMSRSA